MCRRRMSVVFLVGFFNFLMSSMLPMETALAAPQHAFYVSPTSSDKNVGTESKPFGTIERAREAVRQVNRQMTGDVVIVLRGGTYAIDRTIVFDHRDSGTGGHNVIYKNHPGETPVISGGKSITAWQPDSEGRWKASTSIDDFRQLYVNNVRAVRARGGPLPDAELFGKDGYKTTSVKMADWGNPGEIEFCYYVMWGEFKAWTHTRCKVESIKRDASHAIVTMQQPYFTIARNKRGVRPKLPSYVENSLELLDEPGEWYLDRAAHTVYYMPRPDQQMSDVRVIAPALEKLVELRGTLDQPVHNIRFEGITFADASWLLPNKTGLIDTQANFRLDPNKLVKYVDGTLNMVHNEHLKSPSNIVCRGSKSITFDRCTFTRLGSGGIDLEFGSQDNVISGCEFYDISGTAIQVGDVLKVDHHPDDPRAVVKNNTIVNNYIHHTCVEYQGGVGIFVGYTDSTTIAHNEICHLPYSGISVGWGWGHEDAGGGGEPPGYQPFVYDTPTPAKNNRIEKNHIHHVMDVLTDGGGVYMLGNMSGSVIRQNHIHDNKGAFGGVYLDKGSGFIEVTDNLVYNVNKAMVFNNRYQNRIATCNVHDNFFDIKPSSEPLRPGRAGKLEAVQKVVVESGLEPVYRDLLKKHQ